MRADAKAEYIRQRSPWSAIDGVRSFVTVLFAILCEGVSRELRDMRMFFVNCSLSSIRYTWLLAKRALVSNSVMVIHNIWPAIVKTGLSDSPLGCLRFRSVLTSSSSSLREASRYIGNSLRKYGPFQNSLRISHCVAK